MAWAIGVLALSTALTLGFWWRAGSERRNIQAHFAGIPAAGVAEEVKALGQIAAAHTFNWSRFLSRVEGVMPARMRIESITPDFNRGQVSLAGLAASETELVALIHALQSAPWCRGVSLGEQRVADPAQPADLGGVQFSLAFIYLSETAP
jgi:hypothetical protein